MKKIISILLACIFCLSICTACGSKSVETKEDSKGNDVSQSEESETYVFTDSVGRKVTIPKKIERIAPSGTLAQAQPQLIIDIGEHKKSTKEDMDSIQQQLGIPAIFIFK